MKKNARKETTEKPAERGLKDNGEIESQVEVEELCELERKLAKLYLEHAIPADEDIDLDAMSDFDKKRLRAHYHIILWLRRSKAHHREKSFAYGYLELIDTLIKALGRLPLSQQQKAAGKRDSWPVLLPKQAAAQKEALKTFAILEIGSECVLESAKKKPMSFDSAINQLARHYRDKLAADQFIPPRMKICD